MAAAIDPKACARRLTVAGINDCYQPEFYL